MTQNEFEVAMSKLKAAECSEINDVMMRVEELDKEKRALLEEVRGLKDELEGKYIELSHLKDMRGVEMLKIRGIRGRYLELKGELKEELDVEVKDVADDNDVKGVV